MPIDDEGGINFDLTLDDVLNKSSDEGKTETKTEVKTPEVSQEYLTRISNLEKSNDTLRGLLGQLVEVVKEKAEGEKPDPIDSINDDDIDFNEPGKVKSFFTQFRESLLSDVKALITSEIKPSLSVIDQNAQAQALFAKLNEEQKEVKDKYSDYDNYLAGMRDLNRVAKNSLSVEALYLLAKQGGLINEKYEKKTEKKGETNVRKFIPKKTETENVETEKPKKVKSITDAIESALEELAG